MYKPLARQLISIVVVGFHEIIVGTPTPTPTHHPPPPLCFPQYSALPPPSLPFTHIFVKVAHLGADGGHKLGSEILL